MDKIVETEKFVINEKYIVEEKIGEGAFGKIFKGYFLSFT